MIREDPAKLSGQFGLQACEFGLDVLSRFIDRGRSEQRSGFLVHVIPSEGCGALFSQEISEMPRSINVVGG
ncbi:MAG: hypothetical protein OEU92_11620 [Alphaproteobacteria bacterium]|nr:hypothetical protein [Alphaproteobacteria bacterium]